MKPFGYPSKRLAILRREILVIALAAIGGGGFALLGMPAAWLSGSALLSVTVALLRPLPSLRRSWFDATMVLSGVILGSAATPEALAAAARYPASLLVLLIGIVAIMLVTGAYLRHVARWPWVDALLATAPGALATVLAVAQTKGADIGRISVVQLFRLLVLVALLPSAMQLSGAVAGTPAPVVNAIDAGTMFGVTMAGLALGLVFQRLGLSAPLMLGATLASSVLHATGLIEGGLPLQIQIAVQVLLGATMGGRIAHIPRSELRRLFPLAIGSFAVSIVVAFLFAWPAAWLAGVSYASGMAAFAPGGLEAMAMLAFAMGLDTLYVGAHHLMRFVAVGLAVPLVMGRMGNAPRRRPPAG
ncbi:AbrB family transcriptional regulator [Bosea sp. (in: a-proteobacteria)]|uniref:AbrB family transcriptional regulator n=1 Tax=Bosea sp. (in: a-proteobacteria) TaxID=1871050 RepID=UPI002637A1EA|nr:AbrB family transcriptional regulator [Bosea sp. (in: a-proteobacteria)]MCO5092464.1 AbrB family transcriptional regulator [Bosea sp. (in: a-proteobacteria)]